MIKIIITLLTCINFTTVMAADKAEPLITPSMEIFGRTYTIKKQFYKTQAEDLENILNYKSELTADDIILSKTKTIQLETYQYLLQLTQKHPLEQTLKCLSKNPLGAYCIVEPFGQFYLNNLSSV